MILVRYSLRTITYPRATWISGSESTESGFTLERLDTRLTLTRLMKTRENCVFAFQIVDFEEIPINGEYVVVAESYNPATGEFIRYCVEGHELFN